MASSSLRFDCFKVSQILLHASAAKPAVIALEDVTSRDLPEVSLEDVTSGDLPEVSLKDVTSRDVPEVSL